MARKALTNSSNSRKAEVEKDLKVGKKTKHAIRAYNRCSQCSKVRGYMRRFDLCRICFRELAAEGMIMGVRKSSW